MASPATSFAPRTIVQDDQGNHFQIIKPVGNGLIIEAESVATKEVFHIPVQELYQSDRQVL